MDIVFSLLGMMAIGLVMAVMLTFGFALLLWFMVVAVIVSLGIMARVYWLKWQGGYHTSSSTDIIEVEYKDITDK